MPSSTNVPGHEGRITATTDSSPAVFVVDDDVSVRESLELLIRSEGWRAETFSSAADFLSRPRCTTPCCLILDMTLPDINGLELQQRIVADGLGMPVIVITAYGDVSTTVRAMKAGAVEFLTKPFDTETLLGAIRVAIERSRAMLMHERRRDAARGCFESLTQRERQVMELVVQGRLNKQIGADLGISEITVKAHRGRVMQKMKVDSLAALVNVATLLNLAVDCSDLSNLFKMFS